MPRASSLYRLARESRYIRISAPDASHGGYVRGGRPHLFPRRGGPAIPPPPRPPSHPARLVLQLVASRCPRNASSSHACSSPLIAHQRNTAARPPFSYPCRTRCLRITTPANRLTQEPSREVSPEPTPARASFDSPAIRGSLAALHRLRNQQLQPVSPRSLALLPWNPCRPTATDLHSILYPSAASRIFSPVPASPRRRSLLDVSARQWQHDIDVNTNDRSTVDTRTVAAARLGPLALGLAEI
ncbi:hypothetical protein K466DRAFT_207996 [Polyporus arcularius HHB13444]|uniref:Uncharacterized protein n=1 Tax=Polyporus arcularius HHB13444 TaxID=1314778 RepID=A0A5C3P9S0_9APHY|nr:hypothetical protein K466DRAFT_207996 [Polyporus arcularius HHB13444]